MDLNLIDIVARAPNAAPVVNAGTDQTIHLPSAATLTGAISDDGNPNGTISPTWSMVSGPAAMLFANPASPATTATFYQAGTYILRLQVSDSALSNYAQCQVTVLPIPQNTPPTVQAGPDQAAMIQADSHNNYLPLSLSLSGSVSDDGLPAYPGTTVTRWSITSGPGKVTFANAGALSTSATFTAYGTYILRLTASDSILPACDELTVRIKRPGDFDGSGLVDGSDFLIWQRNYNHGTVASHEPIVDANFSDPNYANAHGDANGDGRVDGSDFLIWQRNYNKP